MFNFKSVGHFFATVAHDTKVVADWLTNHQAQINADINTIGTVISIADPALAPLAGTIERAGEAALGEVLAVVSKLSDAEAAKGASVTLDSAFVQEAKNLIASIEKIKPGSTIVPANLVAPAPVSASPKPATAASASTISAAAVPQPVAAK